MSQHPGPYWEKPCAASGLHSFRYRGNYGWVMIGATDLNDALRQAQRSLSSGTATMDNLEVWVGPRDTGSYEPVELGIQPRTVARTRKRNIQKNRTDKA